MNCQIIIRCEICSMLRFHSKGWRSKMPLKAVRDERDRLAVEVKSDTDPLQRKASQKFKVEGDQIKAHTSRLARAGRGLSGTPLQLPDLHRCWAWQPVWFALWNWGCTVAGRHANPVW